MDALAKEGLSQYNLALQEGLAPILQYDYLQKAYRSFNGAYLRAASLEDKYFIIYASVHAHYHVGCL